MFECHKLIADFIFLRHCNFFFFYLFFICFVLYLRKIALSKISSFLFFLICFVLYLRKIAFRNFVYCIVLSHEIAFFKTLFICCWVFSLFVF